MEFAMLPPEINSGRMYAGAGPGPLLAAATAWDALADELGSAAASYESVISQLTSGWLGPASTSMAAAAAPYAAWMRTAAAGAEHTATQATAGVSAYETAFAMTVPPPVIAANRAQLAALVATNFLGQNTPAIAATEAQYAEMWAQDAVAMYGYADASAAASTLTPFTPPNQVSDPAAPALQATAVAQAAGASAATNTPVSVSQLSAAVPTALQGLASPTVGLSSLGTTSATAPVSMLSASALSASPALSMAAGGLAADLFGTFVVDSAGSFGVDMVGTFGIDVLGVEEIGGAEGLFPFPGIVGKGLGAAPMAAGLGEAASVGQLSVPPSWAAAAPEFRAAPVEPVGVALPTATAASEVLTGDSGRLLSDMAIAGMAGRAVGGTAGMRRREPAEATAVEQPGAPRRLASRVTELAADLRVLAELRDSGILTEQEFTEEKRRLLGR